MDACNFLRLIESTNGNATSLALKPPLEFELSQNVIKKLMTKYNPNREIGGVLFAEPIFINGARVEKVERLDLRNPKEKSG